MVPTNGDPCSVGVTFLWADLAHNACVDDVGMVVRSQEIRSLNSWPMWVCGVLANALAEVPEFICVGGVPHCFKFLVVS